jgi:hypothetical protein
LAYALAGYAKFRSKNLEPNGVIADLIRQDAPFYDANISPEAIDGLNKFARLDRSRIPAGIALWRL